ncbi:MAG: hypothetical protein GY953_55030, partial [bacterium]|nr:hypothetical protein [bacterium]
REPIGQAPPENVNELLLRGTGIVLKPGKIQTEVDMIYRLRDAGVRVPTPYQFIDGVLVMELVKDGAGNPAPRLGDLSFERHRLGVAVRRRFHVPAHLME